MTNTQHTPGPWFVSDIYDRNGRVIQTTQKHPRGHMFTQTVVVVSTDKANARLIAAAPELLDALEAVLSADYLNGLNHTREVIRAKARAALSKAKGE